MKKSLFLLACAVPAVFASCATVSHKKSTSAKPVIPVSRVTMAQKAATPNKAIEPQKAIPSQPVIAAEPSFQVPAQSGATPQPVYVAELANINDYVLFANAGWDGNWYAGFNVCWMEEVPAPPPGSYRRAFVGAKLGRMKTQAVKGKPSWEKEAVRGNIYIAISSTPGWKSNQKYFLTSSSEIPIEGDMENALEGVGESRWFWTEVPIKSVNFSGPNFLALFSPSEYFVSTASSPILAGGWGSNKVNTWMNSDIKGYPPIDPAKSLKTAITVFEPAIAMKFIPTGSEQDIAVSITAIQDGLKNSKILTAVVSGDQIQKAWVESSTDGNLWEKCSRPVYTPPYIFTIKPDTLPAGTKQLRCAALDEWENTGYSSPAFLAVTVEQKIK